LIFHCCVGSTTSEKNQNDCLTNRNFSIKKRKKERSECTKKNFEMPSRCFSSFSPFGLSPSYYQFTLQVSSIFFPLLLFFYNFHLSHFVSSWISQQHFSFLVSDISSFKNTNLMKFKFYSRLSISKLPSRNFRLSSKSSSSLTHSSSNYNCNHIRMYFLNNKSLTYWHAKVFYYST